MSNEEDQTTTQVRDRLLGTKKPFRLVACHATTNGIKEQPISGVFMARDEAHVRSRFPNNEKKNMFWRVEEIKTYDMDDMTSMFKPIEDLIK